MYVIIIIITDKQMWLTYKKLVTKDLYLSDSGSALQLNDNVLRVQTEPATLYNMYGYTWRSFTYPKRATAS